jgi:hypothetical protein
MLDNEQRAHDLAMFYLRNEYEIFQKSRLELNQSLGAHTFDIVEIYQKAYETVLNQLNQQNT